MKTLRIIIIGIILAVISVACVDNATYKDQQTVENQQLVYTRNQPVPVFDFSLERDVFIQLYQLRNDAVSTYTVVVDSHGGEIFSCPSIGYPLAADVQLTNPLMTLYNQSAGSVVEQPEPNGLFSSKNTVGTWVMCVTEDGSIYPFYTEMNAQTWPFPVVRGENGTYHMADGAKPSRTIDIEK